MKTIKINRVLKQVGEFDVSEQTIKRYMNDWSIAAEKDITPEQWNDIANIEYGNRDAFYIYSLNEEVLYK